MAVQRRWIALYCAVIVALLAGCHNPAANVVGKWKGKMDLSKEMAKDKNKNDPGAQFGAAMANAFSSMMSMEIKADNTFTMTMMMFPVEGKWSVSGDTVSLTPTKVMGMSADQMKADAAKKGGNMNDMNKPMVLKISPDGKKLTSVPDKPDQGEMVFEKESS